MLNFFRRRDTVARIVLGGFLVLICVAMVLFLIPQGAGNNAGQPIGLQTVATVNGTPITGQDLTDELARVEQAQQIPTELVPMVGRQVLNNLVVEQALTHQAASLGLAPSTQEIVEAAHAQAPQLYPGGAYVGDAQASQILASANMTLASFQQALRDSLMESKIYSLVTDPVQVSDAEVHHAFVKQNETAIFDYVLLNPAALASQVKVTPAALQAYYDQHKSAYNSPERRKLEVLLANLTQIGAQIQIPGSAVDQYYHQNIDEYTHPEEVKAAHILIKYPATNPTPAQVAATRTKAEAVLQQVQAQPQNFAALAKKYSEDDATAGQGGELGFIQRNQTVPAFEKAAFSLPVGQISGLVQTEYGFHIIKVEAHTPAHVQPEAEVHDQIVAQLQKDRAVNDAQNLMNRAAGLAQSMPLQQVARQLNLEYFSTTPLSRTDPVTGIGVNPDFANAVFSANTGGMTPPVQVAQGFALAKVVQIIPPGPQPLTAVHDAVVTDYTQAQAKQMAQNEAKALAAAAQKDGLKKAAAAMHLALKTSPALKRSGSLSDAGPIDGFAATLFGLKPGAVGPVTAAGPSQMVYQLQDVQLPSPAEFAQQSASLRNTLLNQKRQDIFTAYTDALVARLKKAGAISIDEATYQRVMGAAAPAAPGPASPPPQPLGIG